MDDLFITRLKRLRLRTGKTQAEVAKLLNIKRSTYGEYERGKITPPIDKLEQLAEIVGTTPQYLLGWSEQSEREQFMNTELTDTEFNELMNYMKYILFKRECDKHG